MEEVCQVLGTILVAMVEEVELGVITEIAFPYKIITIHLNQLWEATIQEVVFKHFKDLGQD